MARRTSVIGLAVNSDAVCLVQFVPERRQVANIGIEPVEGHGEELWQSISASLKGLVLTAKLRGESIVACLPGEHAVIRKLCVDRSESDVEGALGWEFSQHVIGSRNEYVFDFEKLSQSPAAEVNQYLVVGYRGEAVQRLVDLLRSSKLSPLIVDLDLFALVNVYQANYDESATTPTVLVLADDTASKCVLTAGGTFVDYEAVSHEADVQDPKKYAALVEDAIGRLLACAPIPIVRASIPVFLSGTLFARSKYGEQVKKAIRNAALLYPFRRVKCGKGIPGEALRKYSPQLAVAVGLALRGAE
jgi:Tfp pilus assembly PilM family ATPase